MSASALGSDKPLDERKVLDHLARPVASGDATGLPVVTFRSKESAIAHINKEYSWLAQICDARVFMAYGY